LTFSLAEFLVEKNPTKELLAIESTFVGIFLQKKRKRMSRKEEEEEEEEKGGRRRKRKRKKKKKRKRKQRTYIMFCKKTNLARVLSTPIIPL